MCDSRSAEEAPPLLTAGVGASVGACSASDAPDPGSDPPRHPDVSESPCVLTFLTRCGVDLCTSRVWPIIGDNECQGGTDRQRQVGL